MEIVKTPHIEAEYGAFGKTVLMPGDPLRAKFIAEHYLENPVLINNIRGVQGYAGTYKGVKVSVMASGMGMASIGIYSYELYHFFGVENIMRIGSAGAFSTDVHVRELVFAMGASTNSNFAIQYKLDGTYAPTADYTLLAEAVEQAKAIGATYHVGNVFSSDIFYNDDKEHIANWSKMGVLAQEMEAASLYMTAARAGKRALAILTISDHMVLDENTTAEERQNTFTQMMEVALNTAVVMDGR